MEEMKIYTTYFGGLKKRLREGIKPISICLRPIPGWTGLEYKALAPTWDIKRDREHFDERFRNEILGRLDKNKILQDLMELSGGSDIALVCYEKPGDHCHRHLVAEWLGFDPDSIELGE